MEKKFIKQIRRVEIRRWIETLRVLIKSQNEGLETIEDIDGYVNGEQDLFFTINIVAVRAKIKKLFKARNDFRYIGA